MRLPEVVEAMKEKRAYRSLERLTEATVFLLMFPDPCRYHVAFRHLNPAPDVLGDGCHGSWMSVPIRAVAIEHKVEVGVADRLP